MLLFYQSTFTMHHCIPVSLFCFHLCLRDTSINFYTCWQICSLSAARLSLPSDSKHDGSERFVRLKVWSKNPRLRKKSWRIFVWAGLSGRKRRRFHADCILRLVLETKTGSSRSHRETGKKGKNKNKKISRSLNLNWTRGVHEYDGCIETEMKNSFLFWHSEMFLQMKIIPQTALGKCFNKPPIMPCRVIWTRSKIHIIFLYTQKHFSIKWQPWCTREKQNSNIHFVLSFFSRSFDI